MIKINNIVVDVINKINLQLSKKNKIIYSKKLCIIGPKSKMDSLIIINFFTELEHSIKKITNKNVNFLNSDIFENYINRNFLIENLEKNIKKKLKKKKTF